MESFWVFFLLCVLLVIGLGTLSVFQVIGDNIF